MKTLLAVLLPLTAAAQQKPAAAPAKAAPAGYHVQKTLAIGGEGGWDYLVVEPESARLFVSRSTHVMVVDLASGKVLENAATARGARRMALDPKAHRVYLPAAKYENAPEPKAGERRGRPSMVAGSFKILVVGK